MSRLSISHSCSICSILTLILSFVLICCKSWIAKRPTLQIFSGIISSQIFILLLTAISNACEIIYGQNVVMSMFPYISGCAVFALSLAAQLHPISFSVCLIGMIFSLFYINEKSRELIKDKASVIGAVSPPVLSVRKTRKLQGK
ncbi:hypothetical protein GJ496_004506 [Pomphorhynchus laevis]|nr:hypothetical protein GJ496_004506 [Pomphorhynchus laevis]